MKAVAGDVWFPNGMAIIDGTTLVVAESHADRLTAWTITDDGALVERRVWADLGPGAAPDGTTLYIVANHWGADGAGEGVVLTQQVDVAHAGRP
ncbi:MAG TPA: SMP-30/gluconolactonase/LRE family protein [Microthrixaceae bacterium]|nr:SMP-30/gluconolactonase/LRE family protein [Microthrixaceae bacterium]